MNQRLTTVKSEPARLNVRKFGANIAKSGVTSFTMTPLIQQVSRRNIQEKLFHIVRFQRIDDHWRLAVGAHGNDNIKISCDMRNGFTSNDYR